MTHTIAHASDIHFGKIGHPGIVDAMVETMQAQRADVVCLSGDLTQRALPKQFRQARALIERFDVPTLVVPGNHDTLQWWNPVGRLLRPLARYRRMISRDLAPTYEADGLSILGINSAHGRTIANGRLGQTARGSIRTFFGDRGLGDFRVLMLHHHLLRLRAIGEHKVARNAEDTLALAASARVDLVLCGHLHISHVEAARVLPNGRLSTDAQGHRVVVASAGTATSSRGRGTNVGRNYFNIIRVTDAEFVIDEWDFDPDAGRFEQGESRTFDREAS